MVIELIAKDKKEKFQFNGRCKLVIDSVSMFLLVEPYDEDFKMISAMFKWEFVAQKNILFVFAEYDFQDFALIFDNPEKCHKVYGVLVKKGATVGNEELITQRFLSSIFNEISANNESSVKLKEIFLKWIEKHNRKEKEEFIQILKDFNVYDLFYSSTVGDLQKNHRKRKAKDVIYGKESKIGIKYGEKEIVKADNFKIYRDHQNGIDKSKLVIFASSDQSKCYEYSWNKRGKKFICNRCKTKNKLVTAEMCDKNDGTSFLKLSKTMHVCEPREFDSDKFDPSKKEIIKPSNFKIFKYKHNGTQKSKLIVFCKSNKNLCHEYFWNKNTQLFHCSYCITLKSHVTATVFKNDKENENLIFCQAQHICELREFDPEKYKDDNIVKKGMYKITSSALGKTKNKILVIFTNEEKKFYYKFVFINQKKFYYCSKCLYSYNFRLTATTQNEGKDNECVFMSNQKHICEPLEYTSHNEKNIIMAPNFQVVKRKVHGNIHQHLNLFTNDEKSECYKYTWQESQKLFICNTCIYKHKIRVFAKIFKNDANEECIKLCEKPHKCKPENILSKMVKQPDFKLYETAWRKKNIKKIAIFDSKNPKMCYIYSYSEKEKKYICHRCSKKGRNVTAKVLLDESGENYLELNDKEHVCELQKL